MGTPLPLYHLFRGMCWDIQNRAPFWWSDWTDAWRTKSSLSRVLSGTVFVFFACFLPSIAFGNTNALTTDDWLNVQKTIAAQAIGGLIFAAFSAQPLVLLLTTAPIALYIKVIKAIADAEGADFKEFYVAVGLCAI